MAQFIIKSVLQLVCLSVALSHGLKTHHITLPQGEIKGVIRESIYDVHYYSFEGIPFAKPPLDELRFKSPQPAEPWKGIKDCTATPNKCMQFNLMSGGALEGSEDCLYLNVYAKKLKSEKLLPVMVYIYGGAFSQGEASREYHSPDYFMREDMIIVEINYRLGALGFLSLSDPELQVPGNAALRDQVMALHWIKKYISYFNGDPENMTVFGQSAGSVSTHFLTTVNQTRGLFHKAILQSGTVLNTWALKPTLDFAYRLAKYHGYDGENVDKLVLAYLNMLPPSKLVLYNILTAEDIRNGITLPFGPTIEPYVNENTLVPKAPVEMLKTAWGNKIPIMLGGTSLQGLLMYPNLKYNPEGMNLMASDYERILPQDVRDSHTAEENRQMSEKLVKLHFGEKEPNQNAMSNYLELFTLRDFWHGYHRTVLSRLAYASAPTYFYRFDFDSPDFNLYRTRYCYPDKVRGVSHTDDLSYLFYSSDAWKLTEDTPEYKNIQKMIGMWTAFAKTSNPNCKETALANLQPLHKSDPYKVFNFNYEIEVMQSPEKSKLNVWDSVYKREMLY